VALRRALVLAFVLAGCAASSSVSHEPRRERPEPIRESHRAAPVELAAIDGDPIEPLEGGFVSKPTGARTPRRVIVGVHGAGDRADWSCAEWRATTNGEAWVVCPKGVPSQWAGFDSWGSAEQIASRADRLVAALRERWGPWVSDETLTYGGWAQGATLASTAIASRPGVYGTAILVEAGYTPLDEHAVVRDLIAGGVKRLVVSCSSMQCRDLTQRLDRVRTKRLPMWTNDVGLRGHWFDQPVFDSLGKVMRDLDSPEPAPNFAGQ